MTSKECASDVHRDNMPVGQADDDVSMTEADQAPDVSGSQVIKFSIADKAKTTIDRGGRDEEMEDVGKEKKAHPTSSFSPTAGRKSKSSSARLFDSANENRALRSAAAGQPEPMADEDDEDDEDEDDSASENSDQDGHDSWKKAIMIGPAYQAWVPPGLSVYGDASPKAKSGDTKLWDPNYLSAEEVESYLASVKASSNTDAGVATLPSGSHTRDDEQALFMLLQCGFICEEALRRPRLPPPASPSAWTEEECRAFELGLRLYGKDFHMIQLQKVRTRSVGELVQFYYLWKKTERHDVFAYSARLEKKKYILHPGITDYMDRFIDEQDSVRDRAASPLYTSLLLGSDVKRSAKESCTPVADYSNGESSSPVGVVTVDMDTSKNREASNLFIR